MRKSNPGNLSNHAQRRAEAAAKRRAKRKETRAALIRPYQLKLEAMVQTNLSLHRELVALRRDSEGSEVTNAPVE